MVIRVFCILKCVFKRTVIKRGLETGPFKINYSSPKLSPWWKKNNNIYLFRPRGGFLTHPWNITGNKQLLIILNCIHFAVKHSFCYISICCLQSHYGVFVTQHPSQFLDSHICLVHRHFRTALRATVWHPIKPDLSQFPVVLRLTTLMWYFCCRPFKVIDIYESINMGLFRNGQNHGT